jgi:cleavage stimulation factor subunit 3
LFVFFHDYESKFGELSQVQQLEKRMAELFPDDPKLYDFSSRFKNGDPDDSFDPTHTRPIISVLAQMRPKLLLPPVNSTPNLTTERAAFSPRLSASPRPALALENLARASPKRPFIGDHLDDSLNPRKIARGESPLKGAAGRRLDAAKRRAEGGSQQLHISVPPLPADITFLLMALPKHELCNNITRPNVAALMSVIAAANVDAAAGTKLAPSGYSQTPMSYGYPPR